MAKKQKFVDDDEMNDDVVDNSTTQDETQDESNDDSNDDIQQISDNDFADEIVIEIDDEDLEGFDEIPSDIPATEGDIVLSKHKQNGKRATQR